MPEQSRRQARAASWGDYPKLQDAEGRWLCRWCRSPLKGKRAAFCGEACRAEVEIRCNPAMARWHVGQRDKGVCARCGLDTAKLKEALLHVRWYKQAFDMAPATRAFWQAVARSLVHQLQDRGFNVEAPVFGLSIRALWEADHITPVIEGGGACGLDNYRTVCTPCHKAATAELAARRAEARSLQMRLAISREVSP